MQKRTNEWAVKWPGGLPQRQLRRGPPGTAEACAGEESFLEDITGSCHRGSPAVGPGLLLAPRPVPRDSVTLSAGGAQPCDLLVTAACGGSDPVIGESGPSEASRVASLSPLCLATRMCPLACWAMSGSRSRAGTPSRLSARLTRPHRAAPADTDTRAATAESRGPWWAAGQTHVGTAVPARLAPSPPLFSVALPPDWCPLAMRPHGEAAAGVPKGATSQLCPLLATRTRSCWGMGGC